MEPLSSHYTDEELLTLIQWHTIDTYVGLAGTLICLPTLIVFVSSKKFFKNNKLLTLLAIGDLLTCMGILVVGFMRKSIYTSAMETGLVPIESSWSCAWKPFVLLRLLGSLIPPGIVLWISVERFLAVFTPLFYRSRITKHSVWPPVIISIHTLIAMVVGYLISWANRNNPEGAPFYCGRKVSFSVLYTTYVYSADVAGFVLALILNVLTLCKLGKLYRKRKNRFEVKRQLRRIRYMLVISLISTLTVAVPNAISLSSAWFGRLDIYLSEPAVWMIAFKSSINFFVYFTLKTEFRQRLYEILGCLNVEDIDAGCTQNQPKHERVFDVSLRHHSSDSCSSASTAPAVTHTSGRNLRTVTNGLNHYSPGRPDSAHPAITTTPLHSDRSSDAQQHLAVNRLSKVAA
ncbi:serpentine type 7TM GPCR chemoreceptor srsx domain-containing protein [Ditylenchus destructor]|nr:serpentine type 7TM GPCR chemoreceptor srsx domain-containing protein [Ditylenchus destructor]